jgi:hypothetical protein
MDEEIQQLLDEAQAELDGDGGAPSGAAAEASAGEEWTAEEWAQWEREHGAGAAADPAWSGPGLEAVAAGAGEECGAPAAGAEATEVG